VLWLDGADSATITADVDGINTWADKSPQLNNAILAAGGTQHASYELGVQNGLNVVRFDGNDYLDLANTISAQTVFAVVKKNSGTGLQRIFSGSGHNDGLTTLNSDYGVRFTSGTDTIIGAITGNFRMIGGAADGTSSFTALDGVLTNQVPDVYGAGLNYSLGRPVSFNGQYFEGDIAELIVYNRMLTNGSVSPFDNELNDLQYYLQQKWGINAGLSETPPPAPEPSSGLLLGTAALYLVRRRKRCI
jgi:hypothetical protein